MTTYRISKGAFGGICLLILLLPVSRHWKLLSSGERTTGTVRSYVYRMAEDVGGERYPVEASAIEFEADGVIHEAYGPVNFEYKKGRTVPVFYQRDDPGNNCVATFSGFYLNYYAVFPIVLLAIWYAFYLSFNNYRKSMKMPKFKTPSSTGQTGSKEIRDKRRLTF